MASFVWLNGFLGSKIRDNVRIIRIDSLKRRNSNDVKFEDTVAKSSIVSLKVLT